MLSKFVFKRGFKIDVNQVKRGTVLNFNNRLLVVTESRQRAQARGPSHYKLELKDMKNGNKVLERINAGEKVEAVELVSKKYSFMYAADKELHLIDMETFEEISVEADLINAPSGVKCIPYLTTESILIVDTFEGEPVSVTVPIRAVVKVVECHSMKKVGNSDSSSFKMAKLENGASLSVPEFIVEGDKVAVDVFDLIYRERVKE